MVEEYGRCIRVSRGRESYNEGTLSVRGGIVLGLEVEVEVEVGVGIWIGGGIAAEWGSSCG